MFQQKTRRKLLPLDLKAKGVSNPLTWEIPKTGLLAGLWLDIRGSVAGTLSAPNALGFSSIVRNVRLFANSGIDIIKISGPGYHWLLKDYMEDYKNVSPDSTGRTVVTATTFNLSMYLPIQFNSRDPLGLIMLQNEQTTLTLFVEFETDSVVATGATVSANVQPMVELFTVPVDPQDWPPLTTIHQIVEETRVVSGAGDFSYRWPRGNTYVQVLHGLGLNTTPADGWSTVKVQLNQSDVIWGPLTPALLTLEHARSHGVTRVLGQVPVDLAGTSGLGTFGSARDMIYSQLVTELETVITATAAGTLYTVRRQLVSLEG